MVDHVIQTTIPLAMTQLLACPVMVRGSHSFVTWHWDVLQDTIGQPTLSAVRLSVTSWALYLKPNSKPN